MDALFAHLEALQRGRPWGSVLDAGTGAHSLKWIAALPTERWTAVTASEDMRRNTLAAVSPRAQDRVVVGDWTDPALLAGETFDVVLADYLLGAIDGFAPYFQDRLFERLRPHVGGVLYVIGMNPASLAGPVTEVGRLVQEIERVRDACILLAGDRCYREYPLDWVERHLVRAGFVVESKREFPILRDSRFVERQLGVARSKLPHLQDRALAQVLSQHITALETRAKAALGDRKVPFGSDWVVSARLSPG
jgi:hypothetical protein